MEPTKEEDSFQQYRKYLQGSLGLTGIPTPPRPMTPFQRFYFQRKCEEKSKSNANLLHLSRSIAEQWKNLDEKKRQFYQKIYQVRARQRDDLQQQFEILTKKRKIVNGYTLFCKRKYQQITNSNPQLSPNQVNKLVTIQWKNLNNSERQKFNKQSSSQNARLQLTSTQRQQRIEIYNENIKKFVAELQQEKQKILKKYGLTNKRQQKKLQRERKKLQEKQEKLRRKNEEKQRKQKQKQKNNPKTNNRRLIKKERTSRQQKAIIKRQLTALRKQSSLKDKIKIQVKVEVEVKQQPNIGRQTRSRQNLKL